MTQPNWNQAPEGSTHYVADCTDPWHKIVDGAAWYWSGRHENWLPYTHVRRALENVIRDGVPRPVEAGSPEWPTEERIDIIGPNGNEGEHYAEAVTPAEPEDLLPEDWFSLTPRDRTAVLIDEVSKRMREAKEYYRPVMVGLLGHLGLKKLVDISDNFFDQTRAMVAVRSLPQLARVDEIDWGQIDRVAKRRIGIAADFTGPEKSLLREGMTKLEESASRVFPGPSLSITEPYAELASFFERKGDPFARQFPAEGYERLHAVYQDAHHQAAYEKGNERHANDLPFHEQRMQTISQGLNSPDGMAFQVIKKLQEGLQMKDAGARRRELLGALNYLAGIVIFLDDLEAGGDE